MFVSWERKGGREEGLGKMIAIFDTHVSPQW